MGNPSRRERSLRGSALYFFLFASYGSVMPFLPLIWRSKGISGERRYIGLFTAAVAHGPPTQSLQDEASINPIIVPKDVSVCFLLEVSTYRNKRRHSSSMFAVVHVWVCGELDLS